MYLMSHVLRLVCLFFCLFLMIRRPPRSTRTDTLFPYTTLVRSDEVVHIEQVGICHARTLQLTGQALALLAQGRVLASRELIVVFRQPGKAEIVHAHIGATVPEQA